MNALILIEVLDPKIPLDTSSRAGRSFPDQGLGSG
jgi:hypothetical protein